MIKSVSGPISYSMRMVRVLSAGANNATDSRELAREQIKLSGSIRNPSKRRGISSFSQSSSAESWRLRFYEG